MYMWGKATANYPQDLAQDAVCQSHTCHMTGLWFLPTRPVRLNTNEWIIYIYIYIYTVTCMVVKSSTGLVMQLCRTPADWTFWVMIPVVVFVLSEKKRCRLDLMVTFVTCALLESQIVWRKVDQVWYSGPCVLWIVLFWNFGLSHTSDTVSPCW